MWECKRGLFSYEEGPPRINMGISHATKKIDEPRDAFFDRTCSCSFAVFLFFRKSL